MARARRVVPSMNIAEAPKRAACRGGCARVNGGYALGVSSGVLRGLRTGVNFGGQFRRSVSEVSLGGSWRSVPGTSSVAEGTRVRELKKKVFSFVVVSALVRRTNPRPIPAVRNHSMIPTSLDAMLSDHTPVTRLRPQNLAKRRLYPFN